MAFAQPKIAPDEMVDVQLNIRGRMSARRLKVLKEMLEGQDVTIIEGNPPPTLPASQRTLLGLLVAAGGTLTTTELAQQSNFGANTVRPLMARLVASGLVEREPGISGPRVWRVTDKGRAAVSAEAASV